MCLLSALCPLLGILIDKEQKLLSNIDFIQFLCGCYFSMADKIIENDQKSKNVSSEHGDNAFKTMNFIINKIKDKFINTKITFLLVWSLMKLINSHNLQN